MDNDDKNVVATLIHCVNGQQLGLASLDHGVFYAMRISGAASIL